MREFRDLLGGLDRRGLLATFGGLLLLTLYAYQGQAEFFASALASNLALGAAHAWVAECWQFAASLLLLGVLPTLWFRLVERRPLAELGLSLGDWRFGLRFLGLGMLVLPPLLWVGAGDPAMQAEYPLARLAGASGGHLLAWEACYAVYYLGWETFFRGFWQLGQRRSLGLLGAMALQAAASTVLHVGKPQGEFAAAAVAGLFFGLCAVRTRSVLYVFLLHWYVGAMTDLFCLLRSGAW